MGVVERRHKYIVDSGLALLDHAKLTKELWNYAFATATFIYNRTSTDGISPYDFFFEKFPNIRDLKTFGCLVYPNMRPYQKQKISNRSDEHIFIGYPKASSGYMCLNAKIEKKKIQGMSFFSKMIFHRTGQ